MQEDSYHQRLKKLNPEQKKAVETIDGPVMVVAGPGTGKTEILGMRIAYILKNTDTDPRNIFVTTFTESGVQAIKKRLLEIIGPESYHIHIVTFHSFCQQVISDFPEKFLFSKKLEALSDLEKIEIIRSLIKDSKYEYLTTFGDPYFYVYDIIRCISNLKREDVREEDFKKILDEEERVLEETKTINPRTEKPPVEWRKKESQLLKNKELLDAYIKYQNELKKRGLYDFEDMILFVVNAFKKDEDLLLHYQEQFLYILTDEYQDTNRAQNEILELLSSYASGLSPNIFVVGDDDQSIYKFQGASLENILDFKRRFPEAETIVLKSNYRSPQQILDASYALIEKNMQRLSRSLGVEKRLNSVILACPESQNKGEISDINSVSLDSRLRWNDKTKIPVIPAQAGIHDANFIKVTEFSSETAEKFYILERVKGLIKKGVHPKEIAVFARKNSQVDDYAELFERNNIPVQFEDHSDLLKNPLIKLFLAYLKIISDPQGDEAMLKVLMHPSSSIKGLKVYEILQMAYKKNFGRKFKKSIFETAQEQNIPDFQDFFLRISELRSTHETMSLTHFCEEVLKKMNLLTWMEGQENHLELLRSMSSFFQEIKMLNLRNHNIKISGFLETMDLYQEYGIKMKEDPLFLEKNGVQIMTAHKSKGLEFDYVFIVRAVDKNWGNVRDFSKIKLPEICGKVESNSSVIPAEAGIHHGGDQSAVAKVSVQGMNDKMRTQDDSHFDKNEEERRLFFVALTRAKKQAEILYAAEYHSGSRAQKTVPSQFISEIDSSLFFKEIYDDSQVNTEQYLLDFFKHPAQVSVDEKAYIQSLLKDYKLSVTHLEDYLKCPLAFKMKHLLKVPSVKNKYMALGTAFHRALELFFHDYVQQKKLPDKSLLIRTYTSALEKELLTEDELSEMLKIGEDGLSGYFDEYKNSMLPPLANEYNFSQRNIYLGEAHLTGKIDKIEVLDSSNEILCCAQDDRLGVQDDKNILPVIPAKAGIHNGEIRKIRVVDYKTGSIKSDNVIEGNTRNSDGHLKRQILFYKVLCDLDAGLSQKYEMTLGELDFVQGKDGKYAKKSISFTSEEVEDLKNIILDVWGKIHNQEFEGCGERDCEFCLG